MRRSRSRRGKPNIVVIMTDDVGWGDLGSYGGGAMRGAPTPISTGSLPKACASSIITARRAARRAAPRSSPGAFRSGPRSPPCSRPAIPTASPKQTPTIAQYLKQAGYTSVQLGKWHVGDKAGELPDLQRLRRDVRHAALLRGRLRLRRPDAAPELPQERQDLHGDLESGRPLAMGGEGGRGAQGGEEGLHLRRPRHRRRRNAGKSHRLAHDPRQGRESVLYVSLLPQGAQPEQSLAALQGEVSRRRQLSRLP